MKLNPQQFGEYMVAVRVCVDLNPSWRYGQCLFNTLYALHPELAHSIRATYCDPFYNDDRDASFFQAILA